MAALKASGFISGKKWLGSLERSYLVLNSVLSALLFFFFWLGLVLTELQAGLFVLNFLTEFQTSHLSPQH